MTQKIRMPNNNECQAKRVIMDNIVPALAKTLLKNFEEDWQEFLCMGHKEKTPPKIAEEFMVRVRERRLHD